MLRIATVKTADLNLPFPDGSGIEPTTAERYIFALRKRFGLEATAKTRFHRLIWEEQVIAHLLSKGWLPTSVPLFHDGPAFEGSSFSRTVSMIKPNGVAVYVWFNTALAPKHPHHENNSRHQSAQLVHGKPSQDAGLGQPEAALSARERGLLQFD
jgi:hypothetical protein